MQARQRVADTYTKLFVKAGVFTTPFIEMHNTKCMGAIYHSGKNRSEVQEKLKAQGIPTAAALPKFL